MSPREKDGGSKTAAGAAEESGDRRGSQGDGCRRMTRPAARLGCCTMERFPTRLSWAGATVLDYPTAALDCGDGAGGGGAEEEGTEGAAPPAGGSPRPSAPVPSPRLRRFLLPGSEDPSGGAAAAVSEGPCSACPAGNDWSRRRSSETDPQWEAWAGFPGVVGDPMDLRKVHHYHYHYHRQHRSAGSDRTDPRSFLLDHRGTEDHPTSHPPRSAR